MKKENRALVAGAILAVMVIIAVLIGFSMLKKQPKKKPTAQEPQQLEEVTLNVVGDAPENQAMKVLNKHFHNKMPHVTVVYTYQNDLSLQAGSAADVVISISPDYLEKLDNAGQNYEYLGYTAYGLYVNKEVLQSLEIKMPKNRAQLLVACEKAKQAGFIPILDTTTYQSIVDNPDNTEITGLQDLMMGYVHTDAQKSSNYKDSLSFVYALAKNGYYVNAPQSSQKDALFIAGQSKNPEGLEEGFSFLLPPVGNAGACAAIRQFGGIYSVDEENEVASAYISFLLSNDENLELAKGMDFLPRNKTVKKYVAEKYDIEENMVFVMEKTIKASSLEDEDSKEDADVDADETNNEQSDSESLDNEQNLDANSDSDETLSNEEEQEDTIDAVSYLYDIMRQIVTEKPMKTLMDYLAQFKPFVETSGE